MYRRPIIVLWWLMLTVVSPFTHAQADVAEVSWASLPPGEVGWSKSLLDEALEYARSQGSSSIVVVLNEHIIAEGHWPVRGGIYNRFRNGANANGHAVEDVASMQKSVVALLVIKAVEDGLLRLDAPISDYIGAGWTQAKGAQERAINVHHLLSMTSGLTTEKHYAAPAGEVWLYNTNAYSVLVKVLEAVTGRGVEQLTSEWLTAKIGMRDTRWMPRSFVKAGMDANRIGLQTTARDMARLGLLMLAEGRWREEVVIRAESVRSVVNSSQQLNPSYGYLWWLNGRAGLDSRSEPTAGLIPSAPKDLYAAYGFLARRLYVVPSLKLVVTRMGKAPDKDFDCVFWQKLMAAAPPGKSIDRVCN